MPTGTGSIKYLASQTIKLRTKDFQTPGVLCRLDVDPNNPNSSGSKTTLIPVKNLWLAIFWNRKEQSKGENQDPENRHLFIIRQDLSLRLSSGDVITIGNNIYTIKEVIESVKFMDSIELQVVEDFSKLQRPIEVGVNTETEAVNYAKDTNSLWIL